MLALGAPTAASADVPRCEERTPLQRMLEYESVVVHPDRTLTFRLCAPRAVQVKVVSGDLVPIPNGFDGEPPGLPMVPTADGYWTATTPAATPPGTYSFSFEVDGVAMPDPQGTHFAESFRGVRSIVEVPGAEAAFQAYDPAIPHGSVAVIDYPSASLGTIRRAHVYTPPGYEGHDATSYPVLYLVHGASDSDDSWITKGHAGLILDNLIAAGRAKPMILVMPFGHTPDRAGVARMENTDFGTDFLRSLVPFVDAHYRTKADAADRAMAGLSMGAMHTLQFGLPHPEIFGSIGVFSVGLLDDAMTARYTAANDAALRRRATTPGVFYYAIGTDDIFYPLVAPTRRLLDRYGIHYQYHESSGGHVWPVWRDYLNQFAPMLFR